MVKPWSRASRFSTKSPSEAERATEQAARQRDLERELEDQIKRQAGADRGAGGEHERTSLVPGQSSEHVSRRGEIGPYERNDADIDRSRDKDHPQPLELAGP